MKKLSFAICISLFSMLLGGCQQQAQVNSVNSGQDEQISASDDSYIEAGANLLTGNYSYTLDYIQYDNPANQKQITYNISVNVDDYIDSNAMTVDMSALLTDLGWDTTRNEEASEIMRVPVMAVYFDGEARDFINERLFMCYQFDFSSDTRVIAVGLELSGDLYMRDGYTRLLYSCYLHPDASTPYTEISTGYTMSYSEIVYAAVLAENFPQQKVSPMGDENEDKNYYLVK